MKGHLQDGRDLWCIVAGHNAELLCFTELSRVVLQCFDITILSH